ncbi:helix-turn-helix transcriptional regulator [Pseudomonas chlororaphis]|uniref:helix-turn-helix transcriptional regulator n=1 Tax=Pseudomonas chlororaphis TaxID=587753 RepID=UPI000BE23F38|nr:AlpA family transcriptional regulator [Pseudomonas chlororaphis]
MNAENNTEPVEYIRLPVVIALVGLKTTTIYKMASEGTFPKQVKLGGRSVAWVKSEVLQWNQQQADARGHGPNSSSSK